MEENQMTKLRLSIYGLLLLGSTAYALNEQAKKDLILLDTATSSFYTGCMSGIIATIEEGFFKEGKDAIEANHNFAKLKVNCIKQQADYRKFLESE